MFAATQTQHGRRHLTRAAIETLEGRALLSTVGFTSTTLVDFKGWGLFPAPYDRQLPTYADGSQAWGDATWLPSSGVATGALPQAIGDLGFDVARVYLTPTLSPSSGTIDANRMQDLKDHLQTLKNVGVSSYMLSNWTPPAYMKSPSQVRYGYYNGADQYMNPAYADGQGYDYADFIVDVLKQLRTAGFAAPLAISIQNEPDVGQNYDSCRWDLNDSTKATYRNVVKQLRSKLDANSFNSVSILATEMSGLDGMKAILGTPSSSGFSQMAADSTFANAVGGFAWHTYFTSGDIRELNQAMSYYGRDRWMTEYSTEHGIRGELRASSGNAQLDWTFNDIRRMGGDLVDTRANYWFFWRGWHSSSAADDQDLLYGDAQKAKAYHVFQKLWKTVDPGWKVKQLTDDDAELRTDNKGLIDSDSGDQWSAPVDLIGFESGDGTKSAIVLANWTGNDKTFTINGLKGGTAHVFRSSSSEDMANVANPTISSGSIGNVSIPRYSIVIVTTDGSASGGGSGTGLSATYYDNRDFTGTTKTRTDATVNFDWGGGSPDPVIGTDTFSARWTGEVQAVGAGNYQFQTYSDDGVRLWVNGTQIINNWTDHGPTYNSSGNVSFTAGQKLSIKLEFYENGGGAVAKLLWKKPGDSAFSIIPQAQLYASGSTASAPLAISSASTTATNTNAPLSKSYDGTRTGWGSYDTFLLRANDSATYNFASAKTLDALNLSMGFSDSKRFKIEALVGGSWQTLNASATWTGTAGQFTRIDVTDTANVTAVRITAIDDWFYLDEIQPLGW